MNSLIVARVEESRMKGLKGFDKRSLNYVTVHQQPSFIVTARTFWSKSLFLYLLSFFRVYRWVLVSFMMSRVMLSLICYQHPRQVT